MQKDVQLYQSQIEAGKANYKKMQADLQKELQSVFQENTRLNLLMEGKVPKGTILFKLMIFFLLPFLFFLFSIWGGGCREDFLLFSHWSVCQDKISGSLILMAHSNLQ